MKIIHFIKTIKVTDNFLNNQAFGSILEGQDHLMTNSVWFTCTQGCCVKLKDNLLNNFFKNCQC
jgi:hypothetical protein